MADILWRLGGVLALVVANGFFVAAEFSIVTVRKTRIDQLISEGHRGARAVRRRGNHGRRTGILVIDASDLPPQLRKLFLDVHSPFLCLPSNIVGR